jgi:predicted nucleic acid-binding protein
VAGALTADEAEDARAVFASLPVHREDVTEIADEAWRVAEELGLAKTYDAEFLALARLRGAPLVTADARLRRGADRLGFVVDPVELEKLAQP